MLAFRRAAFVPCRRLVQSRASTPAGVVTTTLTCSRRFHLEGLVLAPIVFGGLFVGLWTWKCCMLVIFQNKIIYMPGLPPNARREKIKDYAKKCAGIQWREERTRTADGKDIALCVADVDLGRPGRDQAAQSPPSIYCILYFQGNTSSIPPRLPDLSFTLSVVKGRMQNEPRQCRITFVCLSYRGYWTSQGRPTEKGIRLDAAAALAWVSRCQEVSTKGISEPTVARVMLWGQSIGAGVATNLAAEHEMPQNLRLDSMILETPFTSVRAMLEVLYPQKWLPYKYLWPFLRNHLDSMKNLHIIARRNEDPKNLPRVFILQASKDELVPSLLTQQLYDKANEVGLSVERKIVDGAFHNDAIIRADGRRAVSEFMERRIRSVGVDT